MAMQTEDRQPTATDSATFPGTRRPAERAWILAGIVAPLVLFWAACFRYLRNLPVKDDYDAVLHYLVVFQSQPTTAGRISWVLFHQHNEYKPIWANLLIATQFLSAGRVNFVALSLLGDLQVMLLLWVLWKCFVLVPVERWHRLALFVPIALLTLQLNYGETLNWPMPGLQNLGVVAFASLCLWALFEPGRARFALACAAFVIAIAASGNGFFLFPIVLFAAVRQKRYVRASAWAGLAALCAGVYFMRYLPVPGQVPRGFHPVFLLSLLGAFGGFSLPVVRYGGILFGIIVLALLLLAVRSKIWRGNPALASIVVFLLMTLCAVSITRGGLGLTQSLSSRYKIYADLLLVCLYGCSLPAMCALPSARRWFRAAVVCAGLFYVVGTAYGLHLMQGRYVALQQGATLYKRSGGLEGPDVPPAETVSMEGKIAAFSNLRSRGLLREAASAGVYRLP